MNGTDQYLDISTHLHRFLEAESFSADISFKTWDTGYPSLLAVYYKESILPDFSLSLYKGLATLTIKRNGALKILTGGEAVSDGKIHMLSFRGRQDLIEVYLDGQRIIADHSPGKWCDFGYAGFATMGRGTRADQYTYFKGEICSAVLAREDLPLPQWKPSPSLSSVPLFAQSMAGVENFRIPSLLTAGNITIASADARMEAPGDNPNHICRAVRLSADSGETWSDIRIFCDYGGTGREDGAAAIDGSLLYDQDTNTIFMLFSHTSKGIGCFTVSSEEGFDSRGRKLLWDRENRRYSVSDDGSIFSESGEKTPYTLGSLGRLSCNGQPCGSICHGDDRLFRQADLSFLQLIQSTDGGKTWSEPMDLNPQVKAEWMRFVGAGPGTGIQIREGQYKGRVLFPVYYHNEHKIASSGAIYSDDHGKTWHMGASVNDGRLLDGEKITAADVSDPKANLGECQITELPGGDLKIYLRNSYGSHTMCACSYDGGESWDLVRETDLPDPQCQSHILKVHDQGQDIWLFSNPASHTARVQGVVRASFDGGESWPVSRLVEPGEFGYSCMTQLPDGEIGLIYEGRNLTQRFIKFPLAWLLNQTDRNDN